mgnify:CR=1 FL=1
MAKLTLTDIASGYKAKETLNENNAAIEAAIENTLSRDGSSPNQMESQLDMNSNRVINLPVAVSNSEPITLGQFMSYSGLDYDTVATNNVYLKETAVATANQTIFNLSMSYTPGANTLLVYVNGAQQILSLDYNETNSTRVTFTQGLIAGDNVVFHLWQSATVTGSAPPYYARTASEIAASVTPTNYSYPAGDVRRYGAVGNGVADDTAAFVAAAATGQTLWIPQGTFLVNGGTVTLSTNGQEVRGEGNTKSLVVKRTNGNLFTVSANYVVFRDLQLNNDSASILTGYTIYSSNASNLGIVNCVLHKSKDTVIRVEKPNQNYIENCYIDNSNAPASTPPIWWGISGLGAGIYAGLYNYITNNRIQPSNYPILFQAIGGSTVTANQVGGIDVQTAGGQATVNMFIGNRITGPFTTDAANDGIVCNTFGAYNHELKAGSSGAQWIGNSISNGGTLTNNASPLNCIVQQDSSGYLNSRGHIYFNNNNGTRYYDSAGSSVGQLYMTTANNLSLNNFNGAVQISPSTGNPLQLFGQVVIGTVLSPSQIVAQQDNYNPTGLTDAGIVRLTSDAARDITGIANGRTGRILSVMNVGTFAITLKNESSSSSASNRIKGSADIVIAAQDSVLLQYDGTDSRWRKVG